MENVFLHGSKEILKVYQKHYLLHILMTIFSVKIALARKLP